MTIPWLENGAELGPGINNSDNIKLVKVNLR
jgi:hypothetical protein